MFETTDFFSKTYKVLKCLEKTKMESKELLNKIENLRENDLEHLYNVGFIKKQEIQGKVIYDINENLKSVLILKYLPFKQS